MSSFDRLAERWIDGQAAARQMAEAIRSAGLSGQPQTVILVDRIARCGEFCTPSLLAVAMRITNTSYLVGQAEACGWVARVVDQGDRRVARLKVTEAGRAMLARVVAQLDQSVVA